MKMKDSVGARDPLMWVTVYKHRGYFLTSMIQNKEMNNPYLATKCMWFNRNIPVVLSHFIFVLVVLLHLLYTVNWNKTAIGLIKAESWVAASSGDRTDVPSSLHGVHICCIPALRVFCCLVKILIVWFEAGGDGQTRNVEGKHTDRETV